ETTGLDSRADRIVEVGAVKFTREGLRGSYEQLVAPGCPIPSGATAIHGITNDMVAGCPPIDRVLPEITRFFGDSVLLAHNAQFDAGFLDAAFAQAGTEPSSNLILCTRELARGIFPELSDYRLTTLARALQIPASEQHRALADARYGAELFRRCVGRIAPEWDMSLADLLAYHGPQFRFGRALLRTWEIISGAVKGRASVRIEYRGASGRLTVRDITPVSIQEYGPHAKIVAFCHLRRENRTFRLDRITSVL
ncbi:MAG: WYL domain-containing protein, partial [Candidatus Hydrogenedentota bacterium]